MKLPIRHMIIIGGYQDPNEYEEWELVFSEFPPFEVTEKFVGMYPPRAYDPGLVTVRSIMSIPNVGDLGVCKVLSRQLYDEDREVLNYAIRNNVDEIMHKLKTECLNERIDSYL
jgi:hypothetical protein